MKRLTVLFLIRHDQVLLAMKKRGFGEGRWNGVGGKLEPGETVEQALVRECQEEIGVTPRQFTKAAEIIFDEQHKGVREKLQVHVYVGTAWDGEPIETDEMRPQWFALADIPYTDMWADDPYWLPLILQGKRLRCEFQLDDHDRVTAHNIKEVQSL